MFISLDGIDGTGKSTQCRLLAQWLREQGRDVVECVDPGGTELGMELRHLLLDHRHEMTTWTEALLFMASRVELVRQVIRPALESGSIVLCDRYLLANVVYQGHAGGLGVDELWKIGRTVIDDVMPDLTIVLDLPVADAVARRGRPADRMEARDREYRERVRQGFISEAARLGSRAVLVDASPDIDAIQNRIREIVTSAWISQGASQADLG